MKKKVSILIADDDKDILLNLKKQISETFQDVEFLIASSGSEAWQLINQNHPMIVFADISMPEIDGLNLLKRVRSKEEFDDIYFIMLTADVDRQRRLEALHLGANDYLTKPVHDDELAARMKSAKRVIDMQLQIKEENELLMELAEELERDIQDMTKLSVKFLQVRIPSSFEMLKRVSEASVWIAKQLAEFETDEIRDIEIAAYLSQAGKIFLPDDMIDNPVQLYGQPTDKIMYQVPSTARDIVSSVRRFKDVGDILYHLYENFDGSGFPERIQSWQIPFGSRIIRAALDYEILRTYKNKKPREILEILKSEVKRLYDHRVVILMEHYVKSVIKEEYDPNETAVNLQNLAEGMIITRDIITNSGMKLMTTGNQLTEKNIERIININSADPILGSIYVRKG